MGYQGMPVLHVRADTVAGAYREVLRELRVKGERAGCQGKETMEVLGAAVRIDYPENCIIGDKARKFNYRYLVTEAMWNLCDTSDITVLKLVHPGISKFVADQPESTRQTARWAYGPSISKDLAGVLRLLKERPDSRRAILRPGRNEAPVNRGEGTPPCLEFVQFLVRDGALHMVVLMRSNDAFLGMPYDMFTYSLWQQAMANSLGLGVGTYTHLAGSMHYYLHDQDKVDEVIDGLDTSLVHSLTAISYMGEVARIDGPLLRDLNKLGSLLIEHPRHTLVDTDIAWECHSWAPLLETALADQDRTDLWDGTFSMLKSSGAGIGW